MRKKTAVLLQKVAQKAGGNYRKSKRLWNATPRNVRHKVRETFEGLLNA